MRKLCFTYFLVILSIGFIFVACKKDNPAPPAINYGYNYFPNNKGHWIVYIADSTVLNSFTHKTYHYRYQLKEVIDTLFPDNSGRPTQRVKRYYRDTSTQNWVLKKIWTANLNSTDAERVEDNLRYIKLTFPAQSSSSSWNGNALNTLAAWQYQYTAVDVPLTINGNSFDSTLTVLQISNVNGLQDQLYEEQYARNVGLIYKEVIDESTDTLFHPFNNGVIYYQTYVVSGN